MAELNTPQISNELPQSKSKVLPLWRTNVGDHPALAAQIAVLQANEDRATLAATSVFKDGVVLVSTNAAIRNAYSLASALMDPSMRTLLSDMAAAAWGHFTFHAKSPVAGGTQLLIYKTGGKFVPHYDDSRGDQFNGKNYTFRDAPERCLTVLIYLNDDYDGGELRFNNLIQSDGQPLTIKPRAGDVIAFPPHEQYRHEVMPVTSGTRYNVSQWFDDTAWFKSYGQLNAMFRQGVDQACKNYGYGQASSLNAGTLKSFSKFFCPDNSKAMNADHSDQITDPAIKAVWDVLTASNICHDHALIRCYSNAQTYGTDSEAHKDDTVRNAYTTMIYVGNTWDPKWGGETLFPDHGIISPFLPWNIVQFRGDMLHVAKSPTRYSNELRRVLVFKSRRVYEIPAKDRPAKWL